MLLRALACPVSATRIPLLVPLILHLPPLLRMQSKIVGGGAC